MEKIINLLKHFNFTESESKIYIALLQNGPRSGYEVSKISGVPRSKVYNILEILIQKGAVMVTHVEKSSLYKAESVECVINNLKNQNKNILLELESELKHFDEKVDNEQIWQVKGYSNLLAKCFSMIRNSQEQVLIQVWKEDLSKELEEILRRKQEELGKVLVVLYDSKEEYSTSIPYFYRHGFEVNKINDIGGRWITVTIDSKEMFYATIKNDKVAEGIYTSNDSMVFFANEYIKHDAYCIRLIERMSDEEKRSFGSKMLGVRDLFNIQRE
ncbi:MULTISPECIES: TrmB family transcriptional regulator [Clostridium]|uniref:TrmB family transcriptional regulator n=1 Tax=Clostridium TaxID=1485 RepID=UPI001AEA8A57|nr:MULTISPECIES: TrmB family transcriptional regulator [Clostridium]MBP1867424.1 sugar-specific transcriptional regulator TrmB [Clostridium tertium]